MEGRKKEFIYLVNIAHSMSTEFNFFNKFETAFFFPTEKDLSDVRLCDRLKVTKKNGLYKLEIINI